MMLLALAATLMTAPQDDPSVLYREGLYEEIDQGNLEKALEVYGRLLKGNAEPGLKARAFYRRGACLEKSGKKAEAEQVYRDVQERFPEQAEIVKQARGRLAALSGNGRAPSYSPEAEIQQLILDLGATERTTRQKAIHRLTLIGSAGIPDLKRALAHKDTILAAGAARVLLTLEPSEGIYEALTRSRDNEDLRSLPKLFEARPADQERFLKECGQLPGRVLLAATSTGAPFAHDPRVRQAVEDRLVKDPDIDSTWADIWWQVADREQLPGLVPRLLKEEGKDHRRLFALLAGPHAHWDNVNPETSALLREGLKNLDLPSEIWVAALRDFVSPDDFVRGLFPVWLRSDNPKRRDVAAAGVNTIPGSQAVDYAFEILASEEYPDDVKSAVFRNASGVEKQAQGKQKEQLLKYYLGVLRKEDAKAETFWTVSRSGGGTPRDYVYRHLAEDAPEWDWLLDQELNAPVPAMVPVRGLEARIKSSEKLRGRFIEASLRAMKTGSTPARNRGLWQHQAIATRAEQRGLAKVLPDFAKQDDQVPQVVHHLYMGYATVPPEEWKADVATIEPLFKSPSAVLRRAMTSEFANFPDPALDKVMKSAMSDPDAGVRSSAIKYWSVRRTAEGAALLIEAVRDPYDHNQIDAVNALAQAPSLDAVPALLEHLRSSNDGLRKAAQTALKAIQQYYDEQEQWRKWYEETKKKLPKDK